MWSLCKQVAGRVVASKWSWERPDDKWIVDTQMKATCSGPDDHHINSSYILRIEWSKECFEGSPGAKDIFSAPGLGIYLMCEKGAYDVPPDANTLSLGKLVSISIWVRSLGKSGVVLSSPSFLSCANRSFHNCVFPADGAGNPLKVVRLDSQPICDIPSLLAALNWCTIFLLSAPTSLTEPSLQAMARSWPGTCDEQDVDTGWRGEHTIWLPRKTLNFDVTLPLVWFVDLLAIESKDLHLVVDGAKRDQIHGGAVGDQPRDNRLVKALLSEELKRYTFFLHSFWFHRYEMRSVLHFPNLVSRCCKCGNSRKAQVRNWCRSEFLRLL